MENRAHALMAGLFTLVLLLAAALALWWFSGTREQTHTYLLETRGSVIGLNLESQVRYRGIRAGKVIDIRPDADEPTKLLVEIIIGRQYRLTDRTVAKLNQQGITGLAYVMLEEKGDGQGTPLVINEAAPPRLTIQPGLLDALGDRAGDIAGQVAELTVRLNRLLDERNTRNIARTLDNLAEASDSLKEMPRIIAALRAAVSAENLERLRAILAHLEKATGEAAPLAAETRALVATFGGLAQRLDGLTQRIDRVAASTGQIGERLDADTLPRVETLMAEAAAAMRRLDRLLDTLNDSPQAVLFGAAPVRAGPGESGFVAPVPARKE